VTRQIHTLACVLAVAVASTAALAAQDKKADSAAAAIPVPLKVQVVIARYEGDKKISSMPYLLSVNAGRVSNLRMGTRVPVIATSYTPIATGGANVNPLTSYQYQDVGTNIDCNTSPLEDGRFRIELGIEDSSVDPENQTRGPVERPAFRSFRANNSLVLKDGQTAQFTTAVDKLTGIVTKVDVTLTVVK
jgi:type II secretory pathway component GspD/PulD (secretin)